MNRNCRKLIGLIVLIGALTPANPATAIDRLRFVPLPHLGFGGEALGVCEADRAQFEAQQGIVGRVGTSSSTQNAALWRPDGVGGFTLTLLPGIGGANSVSDGTVTAGPYYFAVGGAENAAGVMKPVLWTEEPGGAFTPHVLPTLGANSGHIRGIWGARRNGEQVFFLVGSSETPAGDMHATLWRQSQGGGFQAVDLGTLGGPSSYALNAHVAITGHVVVVGSAQTPSGDWHACSWDLDYDGIVDRHPFGVMSMFHGTSGDGEKFLACGTARTANGRSIAFYEHDIGPLPPQQFNLMVPGFRNTSADAIQATQYGNLTVGQAWNDPANQHAVFWNTPVALGRTTAYPVGIMIDGGSGNDEFSVRAVGPGIMVGAITTTSTGTTVSPVALIADGTQLPDLVNVTMGVPEPNFSETDLWRDGDGKTLRIKTRNQDGDRAEVEARFFVDAFRNGGSYPNINAVIQARVIGSPDATAQAEVQVFNFDTGMWDWAASGVASNTYTGVTGSFAVAGHVNPATGEVRVRVNFTPLSGKIKGVEIDSITDLIYNNN